MRLKEKKCKGQNKAINFDGCGGLVLVRTYGLCSKCHDQWLNNARRQRAIIQTRH